MYRPKGENFFRKIERDFGFPRDSNCATTKQNVCLGPGTEIQVTGKLIAENHPKSLLKVVTQFVALICWKISPYLGGEGCNSSHIPVLPTYLH